MVGWCAHKQRDAPPRRPRRVVIYCLAVFSCLHAYTVPRYPSPTKSPTLLEDTCLGRRRGDRTLGRSRRTQRPTLAATMSSSSSTRLPTQQVPSLPTNTCRPPTFMPAELAESRSVQDLTHQILQINSRRTKRLHWAKLDRSAGHDAGYICLSHSERVHLNPAKCGTTERRNQKQRIRDGQSWAGRLGGWQKELRALFALLLLSCSHLIKGNRNDNDLIGCCVSTRAEPNPANRISHQRFYL